LAGSAFYFNSNDVFSVHISVRLSVCLSACRLTVCFAEVTDLTVISELPFSATIGNRKSELGGKWKFFLTRSVIGNVTTSLPTGHAMTRRYGAR
jgi:hypothetical protein